MFNNVLIFNNFIFSFNFFIIIMTIVNFFYKNNNIIIKKYDYYTLNLIYNLKIYENVKMRGNYFEII